MSKRPRGNNPESSIKSNALLEGQLQTLHIDQCLRSASKLAQQIDDQVDFRGIKGPDASPALHFFDPLLIASSKLLLCLSKTGKAICSNRPQLLYDTRVGLQRAAEDFSKVCQQEIAAGPNPSDPAPLALLSKQAGASSRERAPAISDAQLDSLHLERVTLLIDKVRLDYSLNGRKAPVPDIPDIPYAQFNRVVPRQRALRADFDYQGLLTWDSRFQVTDVEKWKAAHFIPNYGTSAGAPIIFRIFSGEKAPRQGNLGSWDYQPLSDSEAQWLSPWEDFLEEAIWTYHPLVDQPTLFCVTWLDPAQARGRQPQAFELSWRAAKATEVAGIARDPSEKNWALQVTLKLPPPHLYERYGFLAKDGTTRHLQPAHKLFLYAHDLVRLGEVFSEICSKTLAEWTAAALPDAEIQLRFDRAVYLLLAVLITSESHREQIFPSPLLVELLNLRGHPTSQTTIQCKQDLQHVQQTFFIHPLVQKDVHLVANSVQQAFAFGAETCSAHREGGGGMSNPWERGHPQWREAYSLAPVGSQDLPTGPPPSLNTKWKRPGWNRLTLFRLQPSPSCEPSPSILQRLLGSAPQFPPAIWVPLHLRGALWETWTGQLWKMLDPLTNSPFAREFGTRLRVGALPNGDPMEGLSVAGSVPSLPPPGAGSQVAGNPSAAASVQPYVMEPIPHILAYPNLLGQQYHYFWDLTVGHRLPRPSTQEQQQQVYQTCVAIFQAALAPPAPVGAPAGPPEVPAALLAAAGPAPTAAAAVPAVPAAAERAAIQVAMPATAGGAPASAPPAKGSHLGRTTLPQGFCQPQPQSHGGAGHPQSQSVSAAQLTPQTTIFPPSGPGGEGRAASQPPPQMPLFSVQSMGQGPASQDPQLAPPAQQLCGTRQEGPQQQTEAQLGFSPGQEMPAGGLLTAHVLSWADTLQQAATPPPPPPEEGMATSEAGDESAAPLEGEDVDMDRDFSEPPDSPSGLASAESLLATAAQETLLHHKHPSPGPAPRGGDQ